jgi:uncharacterized protein (UPF0276 family)
MHVDLNAQGPRAQTGPRGVGFGCHLALPDALYTPDLLDFVEITPEVYHRAEKVEDCVQLLPERKLFDAARCRCEGLPVTMHSVSLSIGSAHGMYEPCLSMMDRLKTEWPFEWYSEHLQFQSTLDEKGESQETGIPFPLPPTIEAAELVAARAALIQRRYDVPFLLENPAHYLPDLPSDPEIGDEFGLMKRITVSSGCRQLLDLHNLYCNAINFDLDPVEALGRVNLERVGEIHVAGGSWREGFYMDAHDGSVPEAVWDLLEQTLSRAPHIPAVVFEILDEYLDRLGPDGIAQQMERARAVWRRHNPVTEAAT